MAGSNVLCFLCSATLNGLLELPRNYLEDLVVDLELLMKQQLSAEGIMRLLVHLIFRYGKPVRIGEIGKVCQDLIDFPST